MASFSARDRQTAGRSVPWRFVAADADGVQYNLVEETCGLHDDGNGLLEPEDSVVVEIGYAYDGTEGKLTGRTARVNDLR